MSQGNYEYFNDVGLDKLIRTLKVDDYHVQFTLSEPNAALTDWGMDFASICLPNMPGCDAEKGTPENVDTANWNRPYVLQQYKEWIL